MKDMDFAKLDGVVGAVNHLIGSLRPEELNYVLRKVKKLEKDEMKAEKKAEKGAEDSE